MRDRRLLKESNCASCLSYSHRYGVDDEYNSHREFIHAGEVICPFCSIWVEDEDANDHWEKKHDPTMIGNQRP